MIKTWLRLGGMAALAAAALGLGRAADAATVTVYANNQATGDTWTGGSNSAIGNSGWRYVKTKNGAGSVGINGNLPFDGNGSVYFDGVADSLQIGIAMSLGSFGSAPLLSELTALSYNWITTGTATNRGNVAPVLRLKVTNGRYSGDLVWESANNGGGTVVGKGWQETDAFTGIFSATGTLPGAGQAAVDYHALDWWVENLAGYKVTEISVNIGSGWGGSFTGAVDNITFGFGDNDPTTYKFEQAVPEPGSIVMGLIAGGLGLAGAAWRRRRVG